MDKKQEEINLTDDDEMAVMAMVYAEMVEILIDNAYEDKVILTGTKDLIKKSEEEWKGDHFNKIRDKAYSKAKQYINEKMDKEMQ